MRVRREKADFHHITGAINYLAITVPRSRGIILTVHDLGFYENPVHGFLKQMLYGVIWFRLPLRRVKMITTVSHFTKEKLMKYFGIADAKIRVIANPVLGHFKPQPLRLPGAQLTILHLGSGDHKNFSGLLRAVRGLAVRIVKIGKISNEERFLIDPTFSIEQYFDISNEQVADLYWRVDVLYFASLYEGFGMPIIEAQTVGKPVITSNLGAMKEVAQDSAMLVDPENPEDIRKAILSVWNDHTLYRQLVDRGRANAKRFSREAIASQYIQLYHELQHG